MIKLLFLLIIFVIFRIIKFLAVIAGALSTASDKRGVFINFINQHLKNAKKSYTALYPYIPPSADEVSALSKQHKWKIADETDFLQFVVYFITADTVPEETNLFDFELLRGAGSALSAYAKSYAEAFRRKYNIN